MKIGIDARILASKKCGISTYVHSLVCHLFKQDQDLEVVLFSDSNIREEYVFPESSRLRSIIFATEKDKKKKWLQRYLPQEIKKHGIDIYHATWNTGIPFPKPCPCILTIHDLAPWVLGNHFRNLRKEWRYKIRHFLSAQVADCIITNSFASKYDIERLCRVSPKKVNVIYLGNEGNQYLTNKEQEVKILSKYGLDGKVYLIDHSGIDHPRRNSLLALSVFERVLGYNKDLFFVFTGNYYLENKEYKKLKSEISKKGLDYKVIITGWLSNEELRVLLSNAKVAVIPSLYEGFCLPLLDAFTAGVPTITTNCGSLPEIGGDATIQVDPNDIEKFVHSLRRILDEQSFRELLVSKGKERLLFYDWNNTAKKTLAIYYSCLDA